MRRGSRKTLGDLAPAKLEREIKTGLAVLFKAYDYARRTRSHIWDFAVEIAVLEEIGLTANDLRWLVSAGLVEHASEVRPMGKNKRSFRSRGGLHFGRRTCFVLSDSGARLAGLLVSRPSIPSRRSQDSRQWNDDRKTPNYAPTNSGQVKPTPQGIETLVLLLKSSAPVRSSGRKRLGVKVEKLKTLGIAESDLHWLTSRGFVEMDQYGRRRKMKTRTGKIPPGQGFSGKSCLILSEAGSKFARRYLVPRYDGEERRFTVGGLLVKQFKEPAAAQEIILRAFQELKWAPAMDDPLPRVPGIDPKARLHDTVKNLKRHQQHRLVDFSVEGNGTKVRWKLSL